MSFRPTVAAAAPNQELRWIGKNGFGAGPSWRTLLLPRPNPDGTTHLTHGENYTGALVALVKGSLDKNKNPAAGYEASTTPSSNASKPAGSREVEYCRSSR